MKTRLCYVTKLITISSGIIITHLASLHKELSIMLSTRITYLESIPFLFCIWQYSSFILLCKCLHFSGLPKWPRLEVSVKLGRQNCYRIGCFDTADIHEMDADQVHLKLSALLTWLYVIHLVAYVCNGSSSFPSPQINDHYIPLINI